MMKPITVARQELIDTIVSSINGSGLPAFAVMDILADLHRQVKALTEQQYQQDLQSWKNAESTDEGVEEA